MKFQTDFGAVFVGNVSSAKLVETTMAKSTLDAGWSMLKTMLEYKSHRAAVVFQEVNEALSTQTCSSCGSIPASSPKGRASLGIRDWACDDCGSVHDRDVNAAKNILALGHERHAGGIPALKRRGCQPSIATGAAAQVLNDAATNKRCCNKRAGNDCVVAINRKILQSLFGNRCYRDRLETTPFAFKPCVWQGVSADSLAMLFEHNKHTLRFEK